MAKKLITYHISVGLPASGKTCFAKQYCGVNCMEYEDEHATVYYLESHRTFSGKFNNMAYIDIDKSIRGENIYSSLKTNLQVIAYILRNDLMATEIFFDGLFLTNDDLFKALDLITKAKNEKIVIHYFKPDREICLHNDIGRREVNSTTTIKTAIIEKPNINVLKAKYASSNIEIKSHKIVRKPNYRLIADIHNEGLDKVKSQKWSANEPQPIDFVEFDDIIEKLVPEINFLQYKKIYRACVSTETITEHDYYGPDEYYHYYVCDLRLAYDMLEQLGYIKEKEV